MNFRTYNPAFLSDDELVASYCVRRSELEAIVEALRPTDGTASPHQIVIGPRGSGKTMLLLRVAAELRRDAGLSARYLPVVFAEESYGIATVGEFWLECVYRVRDLAVSGPGSLDVAASYEDLRRVTDDRFLEERCRTTLLDFADRTDRRLVVVVENFHSLLADMRDPDAGWQLRKVLQTEPRIVLLASATQRFAGIDDAGEPLYDLLRVLTLPRLSTEECARLWQTLTSRNARRGVIRSLQILTGGNPRLFVIVARVGRSRSFRRLLDDLLALVDENTEYFRSHLEALPAQERRVYLALADLWKPATAREVAERARLPASQCSAQLKRLVTRGGVEMVGGTDRRRQYYVTERLYNIYHLLRRAGGPDPLVEALVRFMESFYSIGELKSVGLRMPADASGLDGRLRELLDATFARLLALPALERHRHELIEAAHSAGVTVARPQRAFDDVESMRQLFDQAEAILGAGRVDDVLDLLADAQCRHEPGGLAPDVHAAARVRLMRCAVLLDGDRPSEALRACDELLRYVSAHEDVATCISASAEAQRAHVLSVLGRNDEAISACEQVTVRYGSDTDGQVVAAVAKAQSERAMLFGLADPAAGVAAGDEMLKRFGGETDRALWPFVARTLATKGEFLRALGDLAGAEEAFDEVVRRFGDQGDIDVWPAVTASRLNRALIAGERGNTEEALARLNDVERQYQNDETPDSHLAVALTLVNRAAVYMRMDRAEDALAALDEAPDHWRGMPDSVLAQALATAQVAKGGIFRELGRHDDAINAFAEAERQADATSEGALTVVGARAVRGRADTLADAGRHVEAIRAYEDAVDRCEHRAGEFAVIAAASLQMTGVSLDALDRDTEALDAFDRALDRCEANPVAGMDEIAAAALLNKGEVLRDMNRAEEALRACDRLIERFGCSDAEDITPYVALAWHSKALLLRELDHQEGALEALGWAIGATEGRSDAVSRGVFGDAYLARLALLGVAGRHGELLLSFDELQRMPDSGEVWHDALVARALIPVAQAKLADGRNEAALDDVARAERLQAEVSTEDAFRIGWIRALAQLGMGDREGCSNETRRLLRVLAGAPFLPFECIARLVELATALGVRETRDLIVDSPAAGHLRPLSVALELELGMEPRVAVEVMDVAADILARLRSRLAATDVDGPATDVG